MKPASPALVSLLNGMRSGDATVLMADLFTWVLRTGLTLTYTNADTPIIWNGYTYLADAVLVDGLKFKCTTGLDVDTQKITISARETDTVGGAPFLQAMRNGVFDGCFITRERAFLTSWSSPSVGTVLLFKGRVGAIDKIGRTTAEMTVNSDLVLLDIDMPRNMYAPNCINVLYDSGCTMIKEAYGTTGQVGSGATSTVIPWSGALAQHAQGMITFTSGLNTGVTATIKSGAASASLTLAYPLLEVPSSGDEFVAYYGCDHTMTTCQNTFNNLNNFRGFPYVPPPTYGF